MNTENLNGILAQYVQHCKARAAADEGTVWRAVDCFGVNWDIEDSDFPAMFADAMQQAQPTLDNPALQPIGGLQNLMLRDSEVELVRECFRWLYNEDGGDISKRRGRAELFADQINGRFRRVFPRMTKYTMNTANAEQELGGIDDALHLLVYDILHTAYAEQFYPKGYTRGSTSRERAKAVKEKADRAELCIRIGECEQELQELLANPAALPDLTGCKINHKMFGAGTVRPAEGQFMVIDFNGTLKKFSYTASMNSGYLSAEDPNVEARLQAYQDYNKDKDRLEKELKNLKAELVKL